MLKIMLINDNEEEMKNQQEMLAKELRAEVVCKKTLIKVFTSLI
jgi:hypothetical protein